MNLKEAIKNVANVPNKYDIAGGDMNGDIIFPSDNKVEWSRNTDYARISFKNNSDDDTDSYMSFAVGDNGNEYFRFATVSKTSDNEWLTIKPDHLRYKGFPVYHTGNKPSPADIGAATSSHTHSYLPLSGGTVSASTFGPLTIQRSGSANGAGIEFSNLNGTLGYIGMLGVANGGLVRWTADTSTYYVVLDTNNYKTYVTPASIGASETSHTHNYIPTSASCNKNWNWSGQSGQPNWVWGGNDGTNMYVYNPSNFSVNYANSAGNSSKVGGKTIFVQQSQPSPNATGDIWISW